MREIKGRVIGVLVGVVIAAAALGPAAAGAAAEVLVSQPPGPSGVAVPAEETAAWGGNYDDFIVPGNGHWNLEAIRVFGNGTTEHPRTFNVRIYSGGGRDDWIPGEGTLTMFSYNMRNYDPGTVPGGVVRIPLDPSRAVAKLLRKEGPRDDLDRSQLPAAGSARADGGPDAGDAHQQALAAPRSQAEASASLTFRKWNR